MKRKLIILKRKLEKVLTYKSNIDLVEIGRQNLENDIDNEVMPYLNKLIESSDN